MMIKKTIISLSILYVCIIASQQLQAQELQHDYDQIEQYFTTQNPQLLKIFQNHKAEINPLLIEQIQDVFKKDDIEQQHILLKDLTNFLTDAYLPKQSITTLHTTITQKIESAEQAINRALLKIQKNDLEKTIESLKILNQRYQALNNQILELSNPTVTLHDLKQLKTELNSNNYNQTDLHAIQEKFKEIITTQPSASLEKSKIQQIANELDSLQKMYHQLTIPHEISHLQSQIQALISDLALIQENIIDYKKHNEFTELDHHLLRRYKIITNQIDQLKKQIPVIELFLGLHFKYNQNAQVNATFQNKKNEYLLPFQEIIELTNTIQQLLATEQNDKVQPTILSDQKQTTLLSPNQEEPETATLQLCNSITDSRDIIAELKNKQAAIIKKLQDLQHLEEKNSFLMTAWSGQETVVQEQITSIQQQVEHILKEFSQINVPSEEKQIIIQLVSKDLEQLQKIEKIYEVKEHEMLAQQFMHEQNIIAQETFLTKLQKIYETEKQAYETELMPIQKEQPNNEGTIKTVQEYTIKRIEFEKKEHDILKNLIKKHQDEHGKKDHLHHQQEFFQENVFQLKELQQSLEQSLQTTQISQQEYNDLMQLITKQKQTLKQLQLEEEILQEKSYKFFEIEKELSELATLDNGTQAQLIKEPKQYPQEKQVDVQESHKTETTLQENNATLVTFVPEIMPEITPINVDIIPTSENDEASYDDGASSKSKRKQHKKHNRKNKVN